MVYAGQRQQNVVSPMNDVGDSFAQSGRGLIAVETRQNNAIKSSKQVTVLESQFGEIRKDLAKLFLPKRALIGGRVH